MAAPATPETASLETKYGPAGEGPAPCSPAAAGEGRCLRYRGGPVLEGLPRREEFARAALNARGERLRAPDGRPLLFMPVDVEDATDFAGGAAAYVLRLTGHLLDGSRAEVTLTGLEPSFTVKVPDGEDLDAFCRRLGELTAAAGAACAVEELKGVRSLHDGFAAEARFVAVRAADLPGRKKAIEAAGRAQLSLYGNDRSAHYRKIAREERAPLCGWARLDAYEYTPGPTRQAPRCDHLFRLGSGGYTPAPDGETEEGRAERLELAEGFDLERPNTLVAAWDLETIDPQAPGVPQPLSPTSGAFMAAVSAHWVDDARPLAAVVLADVPVAPDPRWVSVHCDSKDGVLQGLALVLRAYAPDVLHGFNDSEYDWPFLVEKALRGGYLAWWWNTVASRPKPRQTDESVYRWQFRRDVRIKISADKSFVASYLQVPGCVMADMRPCFQKLYPKVGGRVAGSLNKYLALCKLPPKADMTVQRMWAAYGRAAAAQAPGAGEAERAAAAEEMRQVAYYNYIDVIRCQQMQVRRSVLSDCREVSAVAFTSLADALYYADGMKVRNLLGAEAPGRSLLISATQRERKESGKYPGAFVHPPRKGLTPDPGRLAAFEAAAARFRAAAAAAGRPELPAPLTEPGSPAGPPELAAAAEALRAAWAALEPDGPLVGLDFASLYPSLIMAYNISPDMAVMDPAEAGRLAAAGADLHEISFQYNGRTVRAWTVRHGNEPERFGLYPATLQKLFARRAAVKKAMAPHDAAKEIIELVAGRAAKDGGSLAEAAARVYAEACQAAAAAEAKEDPPVPSGSTLEEARAERARLGGVAAAQVRLLEPLLAGGPAAAEAALRAKDEEARFAAGCLDAKQKALKRYMNTFYGEMGNSLSSLFVLEMAGGVTAAGRDTLLLASQLVRAEGFGLHYGDTDSVYVVAPRRHFAAVDAEYAAGRLPLEDWWAARVRITMRVVGALRDRLNARLRAESKTDFLKLSYEDVLCPVVLTGKKKYFGVAHVNSVNFRPKALFVRGVDIVKEGVPAFAREIGERVMRRAVTLGNRQTLREIVEAELLEALKPERWRFDDFVRTACWRPDKMNQAVQTFMRRMRGHAALEAAELQRSGSPAEPLYALPLPGERFEYVVVRAEPYSLSGHKLSPRVGDRMEFASVARARDLPLDVAYYFSSIVAGLCARFINSDPEFQPPAGQLDEDAADRYSQDKAKKYLEKFIERAGQESLKEAGARGRAYRRAFARAEGRALSALAAEAGALGGSVPGRVLDLVPLETGGGGEPVETLWASAREHAAAFIDTVFEPWFARYCRLRGIAPTGGDLESPRRRPGSRLLRETALPRGRGAPISRQLAPTGLGRGTFIALATEEERLRAEVREALPRSADLAARFQAGLASLVEGYRRVELPPSAEPAPEPAPPTLGLAADDLAALGALHETWRRAASIEAVRLRARRLAERLSALRASCGGLPPSQAERAGLAAAAAAGTLPPRRAPTE